MDTTAIGSSEYESVNLPAAASQNDQGQLIRNLRTIDDRFSFLVSCEADRFITGAAAVRGDIQWSVDGILAFQQDDPDARRS